MVSIASNCWWAIIRILALREKKWIETGLSNHLKVYKWVPGKMAGGSFTGLLFSVTSSCSPRREQGRRGGGGREQ